MKINIEQAKLVNGELVIKAPLWELNSFIKGFKPSAYDISVSKKKRSLDANAYCWVLVGKIADALHEPPEEVYRNMIRDKGCKSTVAVVPIDELETEVKSFVNGHIGRMVEIGENKLAGYATVIKKYGSSDYTTSEMADFIDLILQDCRALGIETEDQNYIDSLLKEWK